MLPLLNSKECEAYLRHNWPYGTINYEERVYIVFLDSRGIRIENMSVSDGKLVECKLSLKKICKIRKRAKKLKSKHIVLAHNHPSGNCSPSETDIETTNSLIETFLDEFGITVIDHIILTENSYFSFKDSGLIKKATAFICAALYPVLGLFQHAQEILNISW